MKDFRSEMISSNIKKVIHNVLINRIDIFDVHNHYHATKLTYENINIVKVITRSSIRSTTVYYYIDSFNPYDKTFIIFNKHKILKDIKKSLKVKYCPHIKFKFDSNYYDNLIYG